VKYGPKDSIARTPDALVIAESGLNDPRVIRPPTIGGYGCDAQWADDFHHALRALLTGERDGYYEEFGSVSDLAKAYHRPFVHDGQYSTFRKRRFGAPAEDRPPEQFVVFSQNHDQVGNRAYGDRLPAPARPLAAFCVLLSPFTPMLFMGEEYGERAPFQFFSDHIDARIARATREGRRREFAAFAAFGEEIPDPQALATFTASKLTGEQEPALAELYAQLIRARRALVGEIDTVEFDEEHRWLRLRRDKHELICNFAPENVTLHTESSELLLATHPAQLAAGTLTVAALSGSLLR
jgi:maltooligosyltrehalose trehalohydrolase